jgi:hypothetical protein
MKEEYELTTLVETGVGNRHGIVYAIGLQFENIYSIEIDAKLVKKATQGFMDHNNVEVIYGHSPDGIQQIISMLGGNVCWWLDAHCPHENIWPLEEEFTVIRNRDINKDVFIMDDMHHYPDICLTWLESTHQCQKKYSAIIALPRK